MTFQPRRTVWVCALLLVAAAARAQRATSVVSLVPPPSWRLTDSQRLPLESVRAWGGDLAIEREYGVNSVERRTYRLGDRGAEVFVEEAADASAAYGLFALYRGAEMTPQTQVRYAVSDSEVALMLRGRYFLRVLRPTAPGAQLSDSEFRGLLVFLGGVVPLPDPQTTLPVSFPTAGLVPGSEKYALGPEAARRILPTFPADLIGFSQGAELQTAAYAWGKNRAKVLALSYPTPQIARVRFGAMLHFLGVNQERGPGSIFGKREGSFVFLILDAASPDSAARLMDQLKVSQVLTWDERYQTGKGFWMQVARLILANLALVGILVSGATACGAALFVSRRLAARWFPAWSWGRPDEERIIRLNLSRPS